MHQTLKEAARGGKWRAEIELMSSIVTPWVFEMMLVLPDALFVPALYLTGLYPPSLLSPGQLDMAEKRQSMLDYHMNELLQTGSRHGITMPICTCVYLSIKAMEADVAARKPGSGRAAIQNLVKVEAAMRELTVNKLHPSLAELLYWTSRCLAGFLVLFAVYYFIVHEFIYHDF